MNPNKGVASVSTDENARALPRFQSISLVTSGNNQTSSSDDDSGSNLSNGGSPNLPSKGHSPTGMTKRDGEATSNPRSNPPDASSSDPPSRTSTWTCSFIAQIDNVLAGNSHPGLPLAGSKRPPYRKGRPPGSSISGGNKGIKGDSRSRCVHGRRRYRRVCVVRVFVNIKGSAISKECQGSGICPHHTRSQCKDC